MACIVGGIENGLVIIGGDSAGVSGLSIQNRTDEKVFRNGEFLIGFTSSFRMGQLLRYKFVPPQITTEDIHRFMATDFVDGIRACLKDGGFATKNCEAEIGGTFLVGVRGRLFVIANDYQVGELAEEFAACGCGDDIALGAMFATKGLPMKQRIEIALKAAETFSNGVRGPFVILKA